MKIYILCHTHPMFDVSTTMDVPHKDHFLYVDDDKVERWKRVMNEYWEVQGEICDAIQQQFPKPKG